MESSARRLFIALPVDDETLLFTLMEKHVYLKKCESFLKVVPPENFHITLKFFGPVKPEIAASLAGSFSKLKQLNKVEYRIEGLGAFPSIDNPSVIWAGLKCDEKPLAGILQSVEGLASSFGFPSDKRKFIPHLTLARIKREKKVPADLKNFLLGEKLAFHGSSAFTELVLFESVLKRTGAEYKKIEVLNLI